MDEPSPQTNDADRQADSRACAKPNFTGLVSRAQRAEMRVLLAGKWPALKPLPVFKYENAEYRAAIDFDKLRGEWVCRKITYPSNKIQELRGGLTELTRTLPQGAVEVSGDEGAACEAEEEPAKDAVRRMRAMAEWREKSESGALYSELEGYFSESQQEEVYEIIRLTLTARQLQFIPKNVANVFEALSKAGGRLATLVDLGQRKKAGQGADILEAVREVEPEPLKSFAAAVGGAPAAAPVEEASPAIPVIPTIPLIPTTFEKLPSAAMGNVLAEQERGFSHEEILHNAFRTSQAATPEILAPEIPNFGLPSLAEQLREKDHGRIPLFGFGRRLRTAGVDLPDDGIPRPGARRFVLEISGFHVAAFSLVVLFAAVSLTVGLNVGGESFGKRLRDVVRTAVAKDSATTTVPNGDGYSASGSASGVKKADKAKDATAVDAEEKPDVTDAGPEFVAKATAVNPKAANPVDSTAPLTIAPKAVAPANPVASSEKHASSRGIVRNTARGASGKAGHLLKAAGPMNSTVRNPAEGRVASSNGAMEHASTPGAILVRAGDGSKPFRLTLPEKTIAASRTFAMSVQISVLVAPGVAAGPARLQAGGIVSYVWPHYPKAGERHAAAETVKVRTTIGTSGQVEEIKLVSGSASLFSAAMSAIRQWRFRPTLLDARPVAAQEDVTIAFRR